MIDNQSKPSFHSSVVAQPRPSIPRAMEIEDRRVVQTNKHKKHVTLSWANQQPRDHGPKSHPKFNKDAAMHSLVRHAFQLGDFSSTTILVAQVWD